MTKIYDVFMGEYVDEDEVDPIAPPERYVIVYVEDNEGVNC